MALVYLFHLAGQGEELWKLVAVALMEALYDVFDQSREGGGAPIGPVRRRGCQPGERFGEGGWVDAPDCQGLLKGLVAAAAEIDAMLAEQAGRTTDSGRQFPHRSF